MKRWQQTVHYLDRPPVTAQFDDLYSLAEWEARRRQGQRGRGTAPPAWRVDPPQRLLGPALSREEFEQGYRVAQQGREWVVFEPLAAP